MSKQQYLPVPVIGYHAIEEAIKTARAPGELLIAKKNNRIEHLIRVAREQEFRIRHVSVEDLDEISAGQDHRGVIFTEQGNRRDGIPTFSSAIAEIQFPYPLVIVLDHITDPHNLGAIIRSADQFKVDLVVLPKRQTAHENTTVAMTSAGASSYVKICEVPNLTRSIKELQKAGYWVYGADRSGREVNKVDFSNQCVLVLGSEGTGISRIVAESCDEKIRIPTSGHVDSLNVSVAAGILMYEIRRRMDFPYLHIEKPPDHTVV